VASRYITETIQIISFIKHEIIICDCARYIHEMVDTFIVVVNFILESINVFILSGITSLEQLI